MLNRIIAFSVKNKLIIGLLSLGLVLWGTYSLRQLPIDAVPDITNNQVQVITSSPSLGALEVERLITFPIEITMATIPEIEEIRSFSRFGLSVVTLVFHENVDVYWARQQVNERLRQVQNQIPQGVGEPGMAPITTGLGEIYQYVVEPLPGYENRYDAQQLRTIQDWIVRRQLLGTPGVADVSSFGGYLKQYEIALKPERLKAMNISIAEIFKALEANNENTGGAYIEKQPNAYFIRSEGLVGTIADIENISIKYNQNGIPVFIKDVAQVRQGHAVRYGATTRNGQGEVVSAIVMMLKGENSAEVIENVKERIAAIKKSLPEGITITPFLDRTKLVNNAIGTVSKNLIEGALIVIFVLLMLLGNLRAGLIVASVIPLALLFAFGMMNLFGVSGNLMSLGAIDFGLIVDGTVIIVEATLHHIAQQLPARRLSQREMDEEVITSAGAIRNSAAFGEIIILIVYLPILALVGTEGKMFRPMAQTVSFAILGAFILSLTYVPMISALFLSKNTEQKANISDRIIKAIHRMYQPTIAWAMQHRKTIVGGATLFLIGAIIMFSKLGGEFIPTLEEGDFAVETRVMTGSSLENTIDATTKAEKLLLDNFPEVNQVVSKIGAGEIPTDPMPIEAADMMVILKDKDEWVSADNREDLANKMAEVLEAVPGVTFGFQQPIQMRFNELMTGVRQDVAIKIYGEDLEVLSDYARQTGNIASQVEGATDLYIEEVTGVPQIVVRYNRTQLAKYQLTVHEVNQALQAAFAGASAGLVYEGERRFDMVVRLTEDSRNDLKTVQNLYISRHDGHQIPLSQVAEVAIEDGPYQIQRDDTRRRIIVAFNVRNRDVESVVNEIKAKIEERIILAPGYSVTYGGQFQNLLEARQRLAVAVPIALLLIFVLLYFTFNSVKQSFLIFTAIPLAAIGGVLALGLRQMPFSISAGVGFIALFGVAVLNGIVLISEFNRLKSHGVSDIFERIYRGTELRLRPVIMTAAVASMGFLPMALSSSSGAEVQKPLATVVIGGLVSATLLTLVVLPVLYYYFEKGIHVKPNSKIMKIWLIIPLLIAAKSHAQDTGVAINGLEALTQLALQNNPNLQAADIAVSRNRSLEKSTWLIPKTNVSMMYGQYNSIYANDNQFNVTQNLAFPTVYSNLENLAKAQTEASEWQKAATQNELIYQAKNLWYQLCFAQNRKLILEKQDSIYALFAERAALRYQTGETNLLEKSTAEAKMAQVEMQLLQNKKDIDIIITQIQFLLNLKEMPIIETGKMQAAQLPAADTTQVVQTNPLMGLARQQIDIANHEITKERNQLLPEIMIGYFNQSLNGPGQLRDGTPMVFNSSNRFTGVQFGLAIPVFGAAQQNHAIEAAALKKQADEASYVAGKNALLSKAQTLVLQCEKQQITLNYYQQYALAQAKLQMKQSEKGYAAGEIGYVEYIQGIEQALATQLNYLNELLQLNLNIAELEYLMGDNN
ncbi:CusA/CzcA family heavy metal efflux RND transporter [bacterium]|nr:CusA/CzcA family heavy metal efflux RND transporter [bacterium]